MLVWEAVVLGIVQGATEFLPVSSSGHLVLLQRFFGIEEGALLFDTALHGGTLVVVLFVLRHDIWNILRRLFQPLTLYLVIATIPAAVAALLFKRRIEEAFASASFLGFAFLVTSALLLLSEALYRRTEPRAREEMNLIDALLIGILQAVALIPGISRSGATISAALSRRLDRDFAARFSFLLSIPAILGAFVLQGKELLEAGAGQKAELGIGSIGLLPIAAGVISAAVVAFFSLRLTLKIVREHSLLGFALYTGALGILVLVYKFGKGLFF